MEIVALSVLTAVALHFVCIVSFLFYRYRYLKKSDFNIENAELKVAQNSKQSYQTAPGARKKKDRKIPQPRKKPQPHDDDASGTETYTTEQQLVQTITHQQFTGDSINTTALDAKPSAKRQKQRVGSNASKVPLPVLPNDDWDSEWENVTDKRKKKVYTVTQTDDRYQFTLDAAGGIVELPFCEIHFPAESVRESLLVSVQTETYGKFVDDTEDKVFVSPAVHFVTTGDGSLKRQFSLKLHSMKMMGRGWSGNVCYQIERRDPGNSWMTIGRTEFVQAMPVNIIGDRLTSFRAVITRAQSGDVSRNLNVAAYIAKPKISNPKNHYLHVCIYDNSQQTQHKVQSNMQKLLLKMQPKLCNIPFGCNVEFKLEPTQKYTPDDKEIFMRWTEVCKAFVNVRFQIRLNRNESVHPNFEPQFRTMVFLTLNKVGTVQTWKQEEYFHFYWISSNNVYTKKRKYKDQRAESSESERTRISNDDVIASASEVVVAKKTKKKQPPQKRKVPSAPKSIKTKPAIQSAQKHRSSTTVRKEQPKPEQPKPSEAIANSNQTGSDAKKTDKSDEAQDPNKKSTKKFYRRRKKTDSSKQNYEPNKPPPKSTPDTGPTSKRSEGQPTLKKSAPTANLSKNRKVRKQLSAS